MQILGAKQIFLEEIHSTNSYCMELLKRSEKIHGLAVYTFNQTRGRGQRDKVWLSSANQNICLSIILTQNLPEVHHQFDLNAKIAIAIAEFVKSKVVNEVSIKWPNDIYIDNKKVSGLLIENSLVGNELKESIIGIGLNVNQLNFDGLPFATSLRQASAHEIAYDLHAMTQMLIEHIDSCLFQSQIWSSQKIWQEYNQRLWMRNKQRQFKEVETGNIFSAWVKKVTETGELILELEDFEKNFLNGQVQWL